MFSSNPTVDTKYPHSQQLSPVKFRFLPIKFRAIEIALFPFRYPPFIKVYKLGDFLTHLDTAVKVKLSGVTPAEPGVYRFEL